MEGEDVVEQWWTVAALRRNDYGHIIVRVDPTANFPGNPGKLWFTVTEPLFAPKLGDKVVIQWRKPLKGTDELIAAVVEAFDENPTFKTALIELLAERVLGEIREQSVPIVEPGTTHVIGYGINPEPHIKPVRLPVGESSDVALDAAEAQIDRSPRRPDEGCTCDHEVGIRDTHRSDCPQYVEPF